MRIDEFRTDRISADRRLYHRNRRQRGPGHLFLHGPFHGDRGVVRRPHVAHRQEHERHLLGDPFTFRRRADSARIPQRALACRRRQRPLSVGDDSPFSPDGAGLHGLGVLATARRLALALWPGDSDDPRGRSPAAGFGEERPAVQAGDYGNRRRHWRPLRFALCPPQQLYQPRRWIADRDLFGP